MATNHTENYALNLWEPTDTFSRAEFNENSVKLDGALAELAGRVVTGTGTARNDQNVSVDLGFRPKLLLITTSRPYFAICAGSNCVQLYGSEYTDFATIGNGSVQLTSTGFLVRSDSYPLASSSSPTTFRYVAIR